MYTHAWSYSALTAFEQCPWRFYLTRVSKQVKEPMNEAARWGDEVHKHLAKRLDGGTPLPQFLSHLDPICSALASSKGQLLVEHKLTLNSQFQPTTWFAKDAWCRSVLDVGVIGKTHGVMLDWKTGKYKPDNDQLELFAVVGFDSFPELDTIATSFLWLKGDGPPTKGSYTRDDRDRIWQGFLARVDNLEAAHDADHWPKRPSGLCKNYCPVGKANCHHCGQP